MGKKDTRIFILIMIFGYLLHLNNKARSIAGFDSWYSDPLLITAGSIYYVVFFGLLSGFVIAKLLGRK